MVENVVIKAQSGTVDTAKPGASVIATITNYGLDPN